MKTASEERPLADANFVFFGGSTGIGNAAAVEVARRGANILIVGRGEAAGSQAVAGLRASGARGADFLRADLSTTRGVAAAAEGARAWRSSLHGLVHTAMAAFSERQATDEGFEFAFALQYFARAALNRLLVDQLSASGDGRIVHLAGDLNQKMRVNLDDPNFERTRWSFFGSILNTHLLGYLHVQEAARLWDARPVTIALSCVGPTKTKAMNDPAMPLSMRLMGAFGGKPEASARNTVRLLTAASASDANGAVLRNSNAYAPTALAMSGDDAARLWTMTADLARQKGLVLP